MKVAPICQSRILRICNLFSIMDAKCELPYGIRLMPVTFCYWLETYQCAHIPCATDRLVKFRVSICFLLMIEDMVRLIEIVKQAAKEGALLLYTIADPSMAKATKQACNLWGVPSTDILRPTIEAIASHIGVAPSGIPRSSPNRNGQLTEDYFSLIEAIDFTIKQDDGAQPHNLNHAHIALVGVSRTGKTPLSIYLAQKGYKVANVLIVMGVDLPKAPFEINQNKNFGLTINPVVLQAIRKARAKALGLDAHTSNYSEMEHVREELDHANIIFAQNPIWPVIGKARGNSCRRGKDVPR